MAVELKTIKASPQAHQWLQSIAGVTGELQYQILDRLLLKEWARVVSQLQEQVAHEIANEPARPKKR